jgi:hypothetical protein
VEGALGDRAVAEERHRHARRRPAAAPRSAAPAAIGTPAATIPLAPKMPMVGSAMCIEPPRPRLVPSALAISSANIGRGVEALGQAVAVAAVGGGDHVGDGQRPARAHRRRLLPDRQVHEARHLAVAVERGHPLLEPRITSIRRCISRSSASVRGRTRARVVYWSVQEVGKDDGRRDRDPRRFPDGGDVTGKRVVITGASRGLGRVLAHAFSRAGARVVLVARTEKRDLKEVAGELPGPTLVVQR